MRFNMRRYEGRRFSNEPEIDKKIKALYLWFDYEVFRNKLSYPNQLKLIDTWIVVFLQSELYEVVPAFKIKRGHIVKIIACQNHAIKEKRRKKLGWKLYYRFYRRKIRRFLKKFMVKGLFNQFK